MGVRCWLEVFCHGVAVVAIDILLLCVKKTTANAMADYDGLGCVVVGMLVAECCYFFVDLSWWERTDKFVYLFAVAVDGDVWDARDVVCAGKWCVLCLIDIDR